MVSSLAAGLLPALWDVTLKSLVVAALAWVVLRAARVRDANVCHRVWTMVLAAMLLLPVLSPLVPTLGTWSWLGAFAAETGDAPATAPSSSADAPVAYVRDEPRGVPDKRSSSPERMAVQAAPVETTTAAVAPSKSPAPRHVATSGSALTEPRPVRNADAKPLPWRTWIAPAYGLIAMTLLGRVALGLALARRLVRRSSAVGDEIATALRGSLAPAARVCESAEVRIPATCGVMTPVILLPTEWRQWNTETLQLVLAHEGAHVRRRDALVELASRLNAAISWFNPLAWAVQRRLSTLSEQACDDEVLRSHGNRAAYAETLLAIAGRLANGQGRLNPVMVGMARSAEVEERIDAIIDDARPLSRRLGLRGAALLLAIAAPGIALIAALGPSQAAPAQEAGAASRRIAGHVVLDDDSSDGNASPVPGAQVRLMIWSADQRRYDVRAATSDAEGAFAFESVPFGSLRLLAQHEHLASRSVRYKGAEVKAGDTSIELRMKPAPGLRVRTVDRATGQPIAGARVHLTWADAEPDHLTDAAGEALIGGLTPELWTLEVFARGYAEGGKAVHLPPTGETIVTVELDPGYVLEGKVVDDLLQPVENVGISVFPGGDWGTQIEYLKTGKTGEYRFSNLPLGTVKIHASKEGYDSQRFEVTSTVAAGATQDLEIMMATRADGGSVEGVVKDEAGKAIAGAKISNSGMSSRERRETLADAKGQFRLDDVFQGSHGHVVIIKAPGFSPEIVEFTPGTRKAPAHIDVTLSPGHRVVGRVVDEQGAPIEGVYIESSSQIPHSAHDDGTLAVTSDDGKFHFDMLHDGATFRFRRDGYSSLDEKTLPLDGAEEIVVTMQSAAVVHGTVVDAATGAPVTEFVAHVTFSPDRTASDPGSSLSGERATGEGETFASPLGEFHMGDFVRGMPLQVSIEAAGYERQTMRRVVARPEGEAEAVEFRLRTVAPESLQSYAGQVVNAAGRGIAGIELRLIGSATRRAFPRDEFPFNWTMIQNGQAKTNEGVVQFLSATTDAQGRFAFNDVQPAADFELAYWGRGIAQARRAGLEKLDAEARRALRIETTAGGVVAGKIDREKYPRIDDVQLSGSGEFFRAEVSANGRTYEAHDIPPGTYELQVYRYIRNERSPSEGMQTEVIYRERVSVKSGETTSLDIPKAKDGVDARGAEVDAGATSARPATATSTAAISRTVGTDAATAVDENADVVIRGVVKDAGGSPIAKARLLLPISYGTNPWTADTETDDQGGFTLRIPAEQLVPKDFTPNWTMWSYHPQHQLRTTSTYLHMQRLTTEPLTIVMEGPSDTAFVVTDPAGNPVANAVVEPLLFLGAAYERIPEPLREAMAGRTAHSGRAAIPTIGREGLYSVLVRATGYGEQSPRLTARAEEPAERPIALRAVGRIEGRLVADDTALVSGVEVYLGQERLRSEVTLGVANIFTDDEGRFTVDEFAEGPVQIHISSAADATKLPLLPAKAEVFAGETTTVDIPYERSVLVEGRVVTKPAGDPVAGGLISVRYGNLFQGAQVRSDANGRFSARVLPGAVQQQLIMRPPAFNDWAYELASWQHRVDVPKGDAAFTLPPIELVATLPRKGRLIDAAGKPLAKMRVGAVAKNRVYDSAMSDDEGNFELRLPDAVEIEEFTIHSDRPGGSRVVATVVGESPLVLQVGE
jgi:beta-lactamase regulating signal transducer with metallopeptidase domain